MTDQLRASGYDAYECHEYTPGNYGVTLVNTRNGARFSHCNVVCGRQAHSIATRDGQRPMRFLGVTVMRDGVLTTTRFPERCEITHQAHVHCHRHPLPVAP
jgi:hypothetical protein